MNLKHPKAFSKQYGHDYRREEIRTYKSQAYEVVNVLEEYAAKKAELISNTSFDDFESKI